MSISIAFFTEMPFEGKVSRTHTNMRTEFAWMVALQADHYNFTSVPFKKYDLGILIIPKKNPTFNLDSLKESCTQLAVMQEGPHWYFQDYDLEKQIQYFNTLTQADIIFTHNKKDQDYYKGLTNHPDVRLLPSLMIEDAIGTLRQVERDGVIIGGSVSVKDHITIGDGVTVGGCSGVTTDIPAGKTVLGFPAVDARDTLKQWAILRNMVKASKKN